MNFITHYYLDRNNNQFWDLGLTLPDLLSYPKIKIRITKSYIINEINKTNNQDIIKLLKAMLRHLDIDKWFHSSNFFYEKNIFLQEEFKKKLNYDSLPYHWSHILLEIFLDRYIISKDNTIISDFYNLYKKFDYNSIIFLFENFKNFNKNNFLDFLIFFSNTDFLYKYSDSKSIYTILSNIYNRLNFKIDFKISINDFSFYIENCYKILYNSIENFFKNIKNGENYE